MRIKTVFLLLPALAFLFTCGQQSAVTDHTRDGLKKVSMSDGQVFNGDITLVPGGARALAADTGRRTVNTAKAAQALSLIPFKEVRVMVLWHDATDTIYNECDVYQDVASAFGGRKLNKWNELVAGCRSVPGREVVYEGTLTKSDTNVTGDIYVKPGINVVNIGYIDAADTITWISDAHYVNLEGLNMDFPSGYTDGWMKDYMGIIWAWGRHNGWYNSMYGYYEYYLMGTNNVTSSIGLNKAYADYICGSMMP
jgi:hypothetical protein